jgi:hypothetical protein
MCKRIRLSRARGWRLPENATVVARPTKWGNPFIVGTDGTRAECVGLYTVLVGAGMQCLTSKATLKSQHDALRAIAMLHELKGRDLACWCDLHGPCHADVLLILANYPVAEIKSGAMLDRFIHAPLHSIGRPSR